jgi:hypothetical protein
MQTPFHAQPDELSSLRMFIGAQRASLLEKLRGLTDEQAMWKATASGFSMLVLCKHAAFVERRWIRSVAGLDLTGYWPPTDAEEELRIDPGDTVASIDALFRAIGAITDEVLSGDIDLDTVDNGGLNKRWVLLHLVEELARHAGHADIIRESIDGTRGM